LALALMTCAKSRNRVAAVDSIVTNKVNPACPRADGGLARGTQPGDAAVVRIVPVPGTFHGPRFQ